MKKSELIKKWEQSGILETVPQEMKFLYSKNLEKAQRFLNIRVSYDQFQTLFLTIVYRITGIDKSMDVIQTLKNFIQDFESNKFEIYKSYIDDYKKDEKDSELEFVEKFITNYTKSN